MVCGLFLIEWEEDSLVNKCSSFLQQISMSATATMVAVHKPAPTQMVHSSAAVDLGLDWTVMEWLAVVSTHACSCVMSKGHACIDMHQCTSLPPSLHSAINQCADGAHNCSQLCINEGGSFRCSCNAGFQLGADGVSCNGMWMKRRGKKKKGKRSKSD